MVVSTADVHFRHNGDSSRHGAVICVMVDPNIGVRWEHELAVVEWVTQALQDARSRLDAANTWHFVHGVRHDRWRDGDNILNGIQLTIHFRGPPSAEYYWPLLPNEDAERPKLHASNLLDCFNRVNIPRCVTGLGVNMVTKRVLAREWHETVTDDVSSFCRRGRGVGSHVMRTLTNTSRNVVLGVELSGIFGW